MLYRNGENLKRELSNYLTDKSNLTIFSPYIKSKPLQELLDTDGAQCDQVIVRWEPRDILTGASDLEVYQVCKERGISLYMNQRIHLKLFTADFDSAISGSANISERAISENSNNYNYEICTFTEKLSRFDRIYLASIIQESTLVTDELYKDIQLQLDNQDIGEAEFFDVPSTSSKTDDFLISKLPMTDSPKRLWEIHSDKALPNNQQEENCVCHDIALYNLKDLDKNMDDWLLALKHNFFKSAFISEFLAQIDSSNEYRRGRLREGLRFGAVRRWFADNTTTVPSPRPFELTQNVQILYHWIVDLSDGAYEVNIPGAHSQVIKRRS